MSRCLVTGRHGSAGTRRPCRNVNSWLWAGLHLEGPFISEKKKGAHPEPFIRKFHSGGINNLTEVYGSLDNVAIVTLAPELEHSRSVVRELSQRGVTVSLGKHGRVCVCVTM